MDGIDEYDIKSILNHGASGNTKIYINSKQLKRKRKTLLAWHGYIDTLMEKNAQIAL